MQVLEVGNLCSCHAIHVDGEAIAKTGICNNDRTILTDRMEDSIIDVPGLLQTRTAFHIEVERQLSFWVTDGPTTCIRTARSRHSPADLSTVCTVDKRP